MRQPQDAAASRVLLLLRSDRESTRSPVLTDALAQLNPGIARRPAGHAAVMFVVGITATALAGSGQAGGAQ